MSTEADTTHTNDQHCMIIMGLVKICLFQPFRYTDFGRLQTENIKLKNNIEQLNIEQQLISTDNKVRFYTGIPSKSLFLWIVTVCSGVLPECKVMSP